MERRDIQPSQFPGGGDLIGGDTGFVIGARGGELLRLDTESHFITIAKNGAGKGRSAIIPNLLTHPGSVFSVEIGGASLNASINFRRHVLRQEVYVFDPFGQTGEPSASLNLLDTLDPNSKHFDVDVNIVAESIMQTSDGKKEENPYFRNIPEELLSGLIIYVKTASEEIVPPESRHFPYIASLLGQYGSPEWDTLMARFRTDSGKYSRLLNKIGNYFSVGRGEHYDGIISSASQWLSFAETDGLQQTLTKSDFSFADLRNKKISIYIVMKDVATWQSKRINPWLRLMIERAIEACPNKGDAGRNFKYEDRVLFLLDEFTNLGKLDAVKSGMQTTRQKGITLWPVFQDIGQLKAIYGKETASSFLGAAACIQCFGVNDEETAEFISKRAGKEIVLIPTVSRAESTSDTITENESDTFSLSKSFAIQHSTSQSLTENYSRTITDGWSDSVGDTYTQGGNSSYGHGGSGGGSNWSQARNVVYGTNGSQADQKGTSEQKGTSDGITQGDTVQRSQQRGASNAKTQGLTVTLNYTPQIIPRLDVADVYALLNGHEAQMLIITTNGYMRNIVDGRAYYDQIPLLRYRSEGPEAPVIPIPLPPLKSPDKLWDGLGRNGVPQLALPSPPLQLVAFPLLDLPEPSMLHKVRVRAASTGQTLSVGDLRNSIDLIAQEVADERKALGNAAQVSEKLDAAISREKLFRQHLTDVKIAAIEEIAKQVKASPQKMLEHQPKINKVMYPLRGYSRKIAEAHRHVTNTTAELRRAQDNNLRYVERLNAYGANLKRDSDSDKLFIASIANFERQAEFYYYLRDRWQGLPEPTNTVHRQIVEHVKYGSGAVADNIFKPATLQSINFVTLSLPDVPAEPSLQFIAPPEIEKNLVKWKTWVFSEDKDNLFSLPAVNQQIADLNNKLKRPEKLWPLIVRAISQLVGHAPTDAQIKKQINLFDSARTRLVDKAYVEAARQIEGYAEQISQANEAIRRHERSWANYYFDLKILAGQLTKVTNDNRAAYERIEADVLRLHERRDALDKANKTMAGLRARKVMEIASWSLWDRFKIQTKQLEALRPTVDQTQRKPDRPAEDLTKEMPTGRKPNVS